MPKKTLRPTHCAVKPISVFLVVFILALLSSCDNDDNGPAKSLMSYDINYMLNPGGAIMPTVEPIVTVEYTADGNPSRRRGALTAAPFFTGFDLQFTASIYDEITYAPNKITIIKKNDSPDFFDESQKELSLKDGLITRAITVSSQGYRLDTIDFHYTGGTLSKTNQRSYAKSGDKFTYLSATVKHFTFSGGNLAKIEGLEYGWAPSQAPLSTTLEVFSDYDHASNPTRRLNIFDESFYRALSKNNFRKYTFEQRDINGQLMSSRSKSWTFQYDERGVPTFRP